MPKAPPRTTPAPPPNPTLVALARAFPVPTARYAVPTSGGSADADGTVARIALAVAALDPPLVVAQRGRESWRWRYVDTFDGLLHRAGGTLAVVAPAGTARAKADGAPGKGVAGPDDAAGRAALDDATAGPWLMWQAHDGRILDAVAWPDGSPPAFARDVPAGAFRDALAVIAEPRRLLALVDVKAVYRTYGIVDGEGKTVVRLRLGAGTATTEASPAGGSARSSGELAPWIEVLAVRGYDEALAAVCDAIAQLSKPGGKSAKLDASAVPSLVVPALATVGLKPGGVSGKFEVPLSADARADAASATIFRALLQAIRTSEPGTRADVDPEFLHDFRVAVRRTRAGLTLLQDALPAAVVEHFKAEFGWMGAVTGPTRDLDVYLENMPAYRAALPPEVGRDLGPLEAYLRTRQASAHAELVGELDSPRYAALLADWSAALDDIAANGADAPAAAEPIAVLGARRTWRRFKRVLDDGRAIGPDTAVGALHQLRIEAKKLRYALEFFRRLVPPAEADALIGSLKGLQDNLGTLNDMGVQQGAMRAFAADLGRRPSNSAALLAMGWLTHDLHAREQACRLEFAARFAAFDTKDNRQRYERLFRPRR